MKKLTRKAKKLIAMTSVAVFSSLALTLGVFAWFASVYKATHQAEDFPVVTIGDCQLGTIKLYKFVYPDSEFGDGYDYLNPQLGTVEKYDYSRLHNSFGYNDPTEGWVSVSVMNLYDPIEMIIKDSNLIDMNCNAIYEVGFHSDTYHNVIVNVQVEKRSDKEKTANQIYLSNIVDFDCFIPSDLSDNNPSFYDEDHDNYKAYYPSYKNQSASLTSEEEDYYKISYLADLKTSHTHLYGTSSTTAQIREMQMSFDSNGDAKVYLNVNYAPSEISKYSRDIYINNIEAVYDFKFLVGVSEVGE